MIRSTGFITGNFNGDTLIVTKWSTPETAHQQACCTMVTMRSFIS